MTPGHGPCNVVKDETLIYPINSYYGANFHTSFSHDSLIIRPFLDHNGVLVEKRTFFTSFHGLYSSEAFL